MPEKISYGLDLNCVTNSWRGSWSRIFGGLERQNRNSSPCFDRAIPRGVGAGGGPVASAFPPRVLRGLSLAWQGLGFDSGPVQRTSHPGLRRAESGLRDALSVRCSFPARRLVQASLVAWLIYAVPHFVVHAAQMHHFSSGDNLAQVISLGSLVLLPLTLLFVADQLAGRSFHVQRGTSRDRTTSKRGILGQEETRWKERRPGPRLASGCRNRRGGQIPCERRRQDFEREV